MTIEKDGGVWLGAALGSCSVELGWVLPVAIGPRGMEPPLEDLAGKRTRNGSIYEGLSSSWGSPQLTATQPPVIRILVVEDDVLQREALSIMLGSISESHVKFGLPPLRLDVVSVGSGEEGYEALRKKDHRYHFCIVDITLPGVHSRSGAAGRWVGGEGRRGGGGRMRTGVFTGEGGGRGLGRPWVPE